jgi:transposase InsO family protein
MSPSRWAFPPSPDPPPLNRLAFIDRPTGEVIRRYERARPGALVRVDIKKLGRLRDGGGHRVHGRDSTQHRTRDRDRWRGHSPGYDSVHAAVDDHSRLAYAEVLPDEQGATCAGFLRRAGAFFAAHGIVVQRVLTDNALAYRRTRQVRAAIGELEHGAALHPSLSSPDHGKVERFNRTLLAEWADVRAYTSNTERTTALDTWLHLYNHHRAHTALGGQPPISRVNNAPGSYT